MKKITNSEEMGNLSIDDPIKTSSEWYNNLHKSETSLNAHSESLKSINLVMEQKVEAKILIQDFLKTSDRFYNEFLNADTVKRWQVIEKWSKKIPKVKSCLSTLQSACYALQTILKHDPQKDYSNNDRAYIAKLCKALCIDNYNESNKDIKYNSDFVKLIFKRLEEYGYTTTDVIENQSALTDEEAKKIIMSIPKYYLLCYNARKSLTLEQALEADDLFDFSIDNNLITLEKILDVSCYIEITKDTKVFNPDKMKELADCMLKRTDILNNLENAKKALKFYYQILPNLIEKKVKNIKKEQMIIKVDI